MQGTPRPSEPWSQLEPYGQLFSALVPRAAGVELYDAGGTLRWSSGSAHTGRIAALVAASLQRARAQPGAPGEQRQLGDGVPAYLFWLRNDDGEPFALLGLAWRDVEAQPRPLGMLHGLVAPALECLRRELVSRGSIHRLSAALSARDRDLTLLLDSCDDTLVSASADELGTLLQKAASHLQCRFSALIVPEKSLVVLRTADGSVEAADKQALSQTHRHLVALAQRRAGPVILNQLPVPPGVAALPWRVLSCPLRHAGGRPMGVLVLYRSRSQPEFAERDGQLADLLSRRAGAIIDSSYDSLTGLLNRRAFEQRLRLQLASSTKRRAWSVVALDVDQLHVVNDNCGMHVGDRVLAKIGELLRSRLVPGALSARVSGDRFAVLLPTEVEDAAAFAEALRQGVEAMPAASFGAQADARVPVTISVGVAPVGPAEEYSHLSVVAETACKAAKDRGRNRVEVYVNTDVSLVRRYQDVNIVPNLRVAMDEGRLRLDAQLIQPLQSGNAGCWHFELLLRMIDDRGQTVGPERFLSAAVRYQFMPAIDRWVVQNAVELLRGQAALLTGRPVVFTLNLSGQSLSDPGFADFVIDTISASGLKPSLFCFELTESAAIGNLRMAEEIMRRLRALGCGVALDDFGTGLSSLAYLRSLPIDMLKIDGSFVRDILKDPRCESMVAAIAQLARAMRLTTVAEYVETDEIRLRIAALGVDYGQGFAIARPVPLGELLAELPLYTAVEDVTPMPTTVGEEDLATTGLTQLLRELDPDRRRALG